jgi:hypothetical protein
MSKLPKLSLLSRLLSLGILLPLPAGITADKSADFGLFGFMNNANVYAATPFDLATSGTNLTLTAAQAIAGALRLTTGASGGFTITLPSTVALLAALGPTVPTDGTFCKIINILNDGIGQTGTLTAGDASTTITGTATIATNTRRQYRMTVTSASAITFQNFGSQAI